MKLAFLDIDGVMMPLGGTLDYGDAFAPGAVAAVRLLQSARFKLILHSTWRSQQESCERAYRLFVGAGLPLSGMVDPDEPSKAWAIAEYIDVAYGPYWPAPEHLVVIDDMPIELAGVTHLRCQPDVGLTVGMVQDFLMRMEK